MSAEHYFWSRPAGLEVSARLAEAGATYWSYLEAVELFSRAARLRRFGASRGIEPETLYRLAEANFRHAAAILERLADLMSLESPGGKQSN